MVVKPITLVVVATLVLVGAGTGAYLAVRDNQTARESALATNLAASSLQLTEDAMVETTVDTPVEATEALVAAEDEAEAAVEAVTPTTAPASPAPGPAPASLARDVAPPPEAVDPAPVAAAPPSPPTATRTARTDSRDNPPAAPAGWERLDRSWPSREDDTEQETRLVEPDTLAIDTLDRDALGARLDPEAPPPLIEELVIAADSVIGLQVDTSVSTEDAQIEDTVEARVTRDVVVEDQVAIPAGTRVLGSVVLVEHAGQIRGASRLGVRFHTVVLDDVFELPITTETVYREGDGRGNESAAKIGGAAIGGAILGAILGGRQGAAIGGAAGAAGGTAAAMAGDGDPATLPAGTTLTVRLSDPAVVTVEY